MTTKLMEEKVVLWIEPDDDDFELVCDILDDVGIDLQLVRYKHLSDASAYLEKLTSAEFRWFDVRGRGDPGLASQY